MNTLLGFLLANEEHHSLTFISFTINPPMDFGRGLVDIDIWRMGTGLWKVQVQHGSATWFKAVCESLTRDVWVLTPLTWVYCENLIRSCPWLNEAEKIAFPIFCPFIFWPFWFCMLHFFLYLNYIVSSKDFFCSIRFALGKIQLSHLF